MTTDRDVRITEDELRCLSFALRDEISKRRKSIERADANRRAGATVKHGVLDEHHRMLAAALSLREKVRVAQEQIEHHQRNERALTEAFGPPGHVTRIDLPQD